MNSNMTDTEMLLDRADAGDEQAVEALFDRHRSRLRRMVMVRLDSRVSQRLEPSDVIQEALLVASQRLPAYLADRPVPFYPWLRRICWERLVDLYDQHVVAEKRTVRREALPLADNSAVQLVDRLLATEVSPSKTMLQDEMRQRVRKALDELPASDREILLMRFLEEMSLSETAASLDISPGAVSMRQLRALIKFSGRPLRACLGGTLLITSDVPERAVGRGGDVTSQRLLPIPK